MHVGEITLFILDKQVTIRSDDSRYLDLFARLYPRAVITSPPAGDCILTIQILTALDNFFGFSALVLDDEVYPANLRLDNAHALVLQAIQQRVTGYFLIHAGVVSRGGRGILLVGDPHYGKSTLALELTRRGYCFLSDEMAAIGRSDGWVHPFPRCLSVRPTSAEQLDFTLPNEIDETFGNHLFDIEELFPGRMGGPGPIEAICILSDPRTMPDTPGTSATRLLHLWVERSTSAFLSGLRGLKGVANLVSRERDDHVLISLTTSDPVGIAAAVRDLCANHEVRLLGVSSYLIHRPAFDTLPQLNPISPSQAAVYMLQRFMGGREALLKTTPGGRPTQLFAELTTLISQANCYTLSVGPLQQAADLIDTIAR